MKKIFFLFLFLFATQSIFSQPIVNPNYSIKQADLKDTVQTPQDYKKMVGEFVYDYLYKRFVNVEIISMFVIVIAIMELLKFTLFKGYPEFQGGEIIFFKRVKPLDKNLYPYIALIPCLIAVYLTRDYSTWQFKYIVGDLIVTVAGIDVTYTYFIAPWIARKLDKKAREEPEENSETKSINNNSTNLNHNEDEKI